MTRPASPRELLLANLDLIRGLVRSQARRHALRDDEREELEGYVRLRLVENDYAILRKFEQRSSLRTFLTVVVERLYLDFSNQAWGKWRPSAAARRLGPMAMALEERLYRQGLSFEEACHALLSDPHCRTATDRSALARLHALIPARSPGRGQRALGSARSAERADLAPDPEADLLHRGMATTVGRALIAALHRLRAQDRLLLRLRFEDGLSVPQIARLLGQPDKTLYKRLKELLRSLEGQMRAAGVEAGDVTTLLASSPDLELPGEPLGESVASRPSIEADDDADRRAR